MCRMLRRIHDTNGNGTVDLSEFQKLHGFLTSMQARLIAFGTSLLPHSRLPLPL